MECTHSAHVDAVQVPINQNISTLNITLGDTFSPTSSQMLWSKAKSKVCGHLSIVNFKIK